MSSASAAGRYVEGGICVIPVPAGQKNPGRSEWEKLRITAAELRSYFGEGQNIGIHTGEPSGWLVDVDLDTTEARKIAGRFLPATLTSGRASSPDSHWWFYAEGAEYQTFTDLPPDGGTLLELRSSGHHTLAPPSTHPCGEQIAWSESGLETHHINAGELLEGCRKLAAATLIARHLPELKDKRTNAGGGRHNLALTLAGFLLRRGLSEEDVLTLLRAAWDAKGFAGDQIAQREAHRDLEGLVRDTAERIQNGEEATGGRKLDELVPGLSRKLADFWGWKGSLQDESVKAYMRTDLGNAERFVDAHGEDVRWCTEANRWMLWDGKRWSFDEGAHVVHRLAHRSVRSIFKEAEYAADDQEAKAISAHAVASQSASRIEALLSQARPYLNISMADLDCDTWLVNAGNGTLDLRTGQLRGHGREDLITKAVPFDYDPEASAPRFMKFMEQVLPDPEVRAFVQRYAGYSLTGSTRERVLAFLHGGGKNGKSTLVEGLREAAGEYARNTTVETILSSRGGSQIPNDVAALKGARLVSAAEPEKNRRMAESKVKNLTGSDTVTARFMRGEFFDFKPEFKLWISMNHKPIIVGTDDAIWDRIRLIPFLQRFEGADMDTELPTKLAEERAGIFAWMVRGALDWYQNGLGNPEAVAAATREYREEMDTLGDFFEARCVLDPNATAPASKLYEQYGLWCDDTGERKETQTAFGARLSERGLESFRYSGGVNRGLKGWRGIGIQSTDPEPPDDDQPFTREQLPDNHSHLESPIGKPNTSNSAKSSEQCEPKNNINGSKFAREGVTSEMGSHYSHYSHPPSYVSKMEDASARVEQLFEAPPKWLTNQVSVYERSPATTADGRERRLVNPVAAAIASHLELDAGEIHDQVDRELGKWLVRKARREDDPEASR